MPAYSVNDASTSAGKRRGLPITCDTAPPYFALTEVDVGHYRTFAKFSPPLRDEQDRQAIVAGDNDDIMRRLDDYIAAGASKFILRPIGEDDADILAQTQRLIDETLPAVAGLNKAA